MNCREVHRRIDIVNNYWVHPIAHVQLLNGQQKLSCTNETLKGQYYLFELTDKASNQAQVIVAGMGASTHFLNLIQHNGLPIFNPLLAQHAPTTHKRGSNGVINVVQWNDTAYQLFCAISLFMVNRDFEFSSPGVLSSILRNINNNPDQPPSIANIKAVNTILGKFATNMSLVVQQLSAKGNAIRVFNFNDLHQTIINANPAPTSNYQ